jgi:LuxR family maltose regulon positive regulatory protein
LPTWLIAGPGARLHRPPVLADLVPRTQLLAWLEKHRVHDRAVHDLLTALLDHPPPSLHLVLITRHDPPLPLVRYRGRGQMTEIDTWALRFSPVETAALLRKMLAVVPLPSL